MGINKLKLPLVFVVFLYLGGYKNTFAQLSKKHFIPPLTYAEAGNASPNDQYFYISTPSEKKVAYTIKPVGLPATSYITGFVSKASPQKIYIGDSNSQLFVDSNQTSTVTTNKGYIIEAYDAIYVSVRLIAGNGSQAGALVSKGAAALGTSFRAGMFTNENPVRNNYLNFISVMAAEDNTTVTFSNLPNGLVIKNYTGTTPITGIVLDEGESYIVATNASDASINRDGLIGTLVQSDKPIVVNCGSANGSFHNGNGRDYGIDQIVGEDKIGTEYILVKGGGLDGWENVLVVANQNNTSIYVNGNAAPIATINAGEYYLIEGNYYNSNGNMYIETSNPTFVYQGVGASNSEANQGLFFVPPISCKNRGNVDNIPEIETIGGTVFTGGVTFVANQDANITVTTTSGNPVNLLGPYTVTGNTGYVTYKAANLTGNITVSSTGELYCAYFNINNVATSGSFYSGFATAPEVNFAPSSENLGSCIPNITLDATRSNMFDTLEWFFDDQNGSGFVSVGTGTSYKPTSPGKYKVVGSLTCGGKTYTYDSDEFFVSRCPDDYDNDSIIDNLDVDIDNDGILNCDES
ncbi:IgGFc-binding protein, partial [Tenacibaculum sp. UWU-22]|uniref:IgGFc-binding protein n=1 Tax=Tenacibaculum sp. UWU-22 TaxID=3234187 RepID=UPI0034DB2798